MPERHSGADDEDDWGGGGSGDILLFTCMQLAADPRLLGSTFACAGTSHICEICQMWVRFDFAQLQNKLHLGFERRYI